MFIDALYNSKNKREKREFNISLQNLWKFSVKASKHPFECKDVKVAMNDLMEARKTITSLQDELIKKQEEIKSELLLLSYIPMLSFPNTF